METERPPDRPGRPAGQERHTWLQVPPASSGPDAPPVEDAGGPEIGPGGAAAGGAAAIGAGLGGALDESPAEVPASGRDTVGDPDVGDTPGRAESIGVGEEGT